MALSFKSEDYKNPRLFPIILNKNAFIQRPHPVLVPNTSAYRQYWLEQSKRCVEGFWGEEVKDTFRYMSGPLYWHINMWTIKIQNKKTKSESYTFPDLRDVEWIIFNAFLCCQGFSGFADDETTTCNRLVKKYYDEKEGKKDENGDLIKLTFKEKQDLEISPNVKTPKGKYKEYVEAYEYLKRTFPKPLGLPLYENEAMDLLLLSSRYLGKSYSISSLIGHEYTWQGKRYFDTTDKSVSSTYVGAAIEKYSIELLDKVKEGLENLPGAYGKGDSYVPSPLYRNSKGTFKPRGIYIHEYDVFENGVKRTKGSGSKIYHGNLGENPGDALGKRLTKIFVDEVGELDKADLVHANNERAMKTAFKMGFVTATGCVCAGTKVWTNEGKLVNIEQLKKSDGVLGYDGDKIIPQDLTFVRAGEYKECCKIKFVGGNSISCSLDHPFLTQYKKSINTSTNRRYAEFVLAKDLKQGSKVCVASEIPVFGQLNHEDAYLFGLLIGDGYYGSFGKSPTVSSNDPTVIEYLNSKYNCHTKKQFIQKNGNVYNEILLSYNDLIPKLKEAGMLGQSKQAKRLPENRNTYTKEAVCNLLAGYFDADGNVSKVGNGKIVYTSIVFELLEEVKHELLKLGIHSSIVKENRNTPPQDEYKGQQKHIFRLYISKRQDIELFKLHIPIKSKHKIANIDSILLKPTNRRFNLIDEIRFELNDNKKGEWFVDKKIKKVRVETVKSVELIGQKEVFNLNCSPTHTYLANNIIVGNTGGSISKVVALKDFFYNPARNSFYPFPDMWEGTGSIGLFIPATYADSSFKDENGNTNLELSLEQTLQDRKQKASGGNAVALDQEVMFMPLKPSEIFTIPNSNIFPISLARERLIALEQGLWKKKAQVGWLEFADKTRSTAKWCAKSLYPAYAQIQPINYYALDSRQDLQGAVVIYEHPIPTGKIKMSGNPYRIVYDPVAKDDGGTSLSSILVYKSIVDFEDDVFNLTDTIVAEYIGRTAKLEDTHDLAIKLAMYYNAKVYPETNLTYFVPYAQRQNWGQYLQLDMGSNNQNVYLKTGRKVFGKRINSNEKVALDQLVNTWLRDKVGEDEDGNDIYVVDNIWSMRLLDEIIQYGEGNFDHISSLRLLAFWNSREAKQEITVLDEQDMYKEQLFEIAAEMRQERRLKCLDY